VNPVYAKVPTSWGESSAMVEGSDLLKYVIQIACDQGFFLVSHQLDEVADRLDPAARAVVYPLCTRCVPGPTSSR
jgi:hypothetical protein